MPNNLIESYAAFKRAYQKLKEFIDTDNGSEKDRSAIIHGFECTFELWWKTLQRFLENTETITEYGPGATIRNAFQYGLLDEGQDYMDMLKARNLIAHTYKEDVAKDIYDRIVKNYVDLLQGFIEKFDTKIL